VSMKLAAVLAAALAGLGAVSFDSTATAGAADSGCTASATQGYAYAGHQADRLAHGVRATLTALRRATVEQGHVAAWVGVGGRGAGPNGADEWLQAGLAQLPDAALILYAEIKRPGAGPRFVELDAAVEPGVSHEVAVLEVRGRPSWWRVWVNGEAAVGPIQLAGSSGRWSPVATAESWSRGRACNDFAFRFEEVAVAGGPGGSWRTFTSGHRFLDTGFRLGTLRPTGRAGVGRSFRFVAASL
jgi:hypothetical protein